MTFKNLSSEMEILDFWFSLEVQPFWFVKDKEFDEAIRKRYEKAYEEMIETLKDGNLDMFKKSEDLLAFVIALDQFPRNMFRDTPKAYATDDLALKIAKFAVEKEFERELPTAAHHNFLYMPYMHSENLADQEEGIRLFSTIPGNQEAIDYARQHRDIISKFGRFPHRNKILGRESTPEELEFMKTNPGF